jgi:hypothetical protein
MNDYDTITTTFQDVPVWIPFCPQRNAEPIPRARPQRSGDVPPSFGRLQQGSKAETAELH